MTPEDRTEIECLMYRYARYVDTTEYDALGALFAKGRVTSNKGDGKEGSSLAGAEAVSRFYATTNKSYGDESARTHHVVTNPEFEPGRDGAVDVRSCFTVFQRTPTLPLQPIVCGRYRDRFVKDGGRWRFEEKYIEVTLVGDISQHLNIPL